MKLSKTICPAFALCFSVLAFQVPYLLVVGDREKENGAVAVRTRSGEDLGSMSVQAFIERLQAEQSV